MANTSEMFAFVVGEVAEAFYGRADLAKYPLGMALVENFIIDYKGGLLSRPGTEFIDARETGISRFARFRGLDKDYCLLFVPNKMYVLDGPSFVTVGASEVLTDVAGVYPSASFVTGDLLRVEHPAFDGYHYATTDGGGFSVTTVFGDVISGEATFTKVYALATPFDVAELDVLNFTQDDNEIVCTNQDAPVTFLKQTTINNWSVSVLLDQLPTGPATVTATASATGTASTAYTVTAVVGGVESTSVDVAVVEDMVNMTVTTGHVLLSWDAVADAEYYLIYRTLVFPVSPFPTGTQFGYIGKSTGLTFQDSNVTADFTKTLSNDPDYFADNNNPALYCRFQRRGIYAGLRKEPLAVAGSISTKRKLFSTTTPVIATDSFIYTMDAESLRGIKHILPLRYGLMLFTDDTIAQLYGGSETRALTATSAQCDIQNYVSISDMPPIAVNLDILFMSALGTEMNVMQYTEYTNSFKTEDLLVLSSHLFSPQNQGRIIQWAAEPHKMIHIIRQDGERVTLTYESKQAVAGWSRQKTAGMYLDALVVRQEEYNLPYYVVRRFLRGKWVNCIELEKPRVAAAYKDQWYVDCGKSRKPISGTFEAVLWKGEGSRQWELTAVASGDFSWAVVGDRFYANNGIFNITSVEADKITLDAVQRPSVEVLYEAYQYVYAENWSYLPKSDTLTGLWWLEGETVSYQADGDALVGVTVEDGSISLTNMAGHMVAGLPYICRGKSLPLGVSGYNVNGRPLALRSVDLRVLSTRGLEVGSSFDDLEELHSGTFTDWGSPYSQMSALVKKELFGGSGWDSEAEICVQQTYPLPATVLGFTYQLDVGDA